MHRCEHSQATGKIKFLGRKGIAYQKSIKQKNFELPHFQVQKLQIPDAQVQKQEENLEVSMLKVENP